MKRECEKRGCEDEEAVRREVCEHEEEVRVKRECEKGVFVLTEQLNVNFL